MRGQYGKRNPFFMYQGTYGYVLPTDGDKKEKLVTKSIVLDIRTSPAQCGTIVCADEN